MTTSANMHSAIPRTRSAGPMTRYLRPLVAAETWSATGYLLSTPFVGLWWFALILVLGVAGIATLIIVLGVPLLAGAAAVARAGADVERGRVAAIGVDVPPDGNRPPPGAGAPARLRWELGNRQIHRNLVYLFLLFVLGPIWFSLTVVAWTAPLSLVATPALLALGYEPTASSQAGGWELTIDTMPMAAAIAVAGAAILPLAPRLVLAMARAHGLLARRLLGPVPGSDVAPSTPAPQLEVSR